MHGYLGRPKEEIDRVEHAMSAKSQFLSERESGATLETSHVPVRIRGGSELMDFDEEGLRQVARFEEGSCMSVSTLLSRGISVNAHCMSRKRSLRPHAARLLDAAGV